MKTNGPKLRLSVSCSECQHVDSERYTCQGDSGHDWYCHQPGVKMDNQGKPRSIGITSKTPEWCPYYPAQLITQVDRKNRGL